MNKQSGDTSFPSSLARSWLIFSTAGLFVFYQLILQSLPSVIRDGLVVDFSLSQSGFGALSSSFYYPYMFLQVPAGLLVVRFGARRLLIAGISLCTLASFLSAFSQEFFWVETARILMGLGAAPTFVCTMALVTRWFPPTLLPILVALTETRRRFAQHPNLGARPCVGSADTFDFEFPQRTRLAVGIDDGLTRCSPSFTRVRKDLRDSDVQRQA